MLTEKVHRLLPVIFLLASTLAFSQSTARLDTLLMGSTFRFVVVGRDVRDAEKGLHLAVKEIIRIENLLSDWQPHTPVSQINKNAGLNPVRVDPELFSLLKLARQNNQVSNGLFDITYAGMEKVWKFDGSMTQIPTPTEVRQALTAVGDRFLMLDDLKSTAFLTNAKSRISFGSIGKSYGAVRAAEVLKKNGFQNFMVDASGDIVLAGKPKGKKCWQIGIFQPGRRQSYRVKCLTNISIVTSGDYEKFVLLEGQRFGHIINPKTGYPSTEIASATAVGPDAVTANFLTTTAMVASRKERKDLLKKFPEYKILVQKRKNKMQ